MEAQRPGDILIVEDDSNFISSACLVLTRQRHGVVSCSSVEAAKEHLERSPFDVALIGQKLFDGDGESLCHHIKIEAGLPCATCLVVDPQSEEAFTDKPRPSSSAGQKTASLEESDEGRPDDFISRSASPSEIVAKVRSLLRLRRYFEEIQNAVGALMSFAEGAEEQDKRSKGHCKRLANMAVELGAVLRYDEWTLTSLERAGYLHDVGKSGIPGALLDKVQPLSPREMQIIQEHCAIGEKMCRPVAALRPVLPIIRHHHERLDGSGYPDGLQGEQIPVLAQVFSIVDVYESLRLWRPYRPPLGNEHAVQVLAQEVAKGHWNRKIFDMFTTHVLPGLDSRLEAMQIHWPRQNDK